MNINLLVLLITFGAIAVLYLFSRSLSANPKARLLGIVKIETSQAVLSAIILFMLIASTSLACYFVASLGADLASVPNAVTLYTAIPCPTNVIMLPASDPFTYAENYVGFMALDRGPYLATEIYGDSYNYAIQSGEWPVVGSIMTSILAEVPGLSGNFTMGPPTSNFRADYSLPIGVDLSTPFYILSSVYVDFFIPVLLVGISLMFLQYLVLIIVQNSAFVILLPAAFILRSFAFTGPGIRSSANALLSLSIAGYLIYPLTIAFDYYAVTWMFTACPVDKFGNPMPNSGCNPAQPYLCGTYSYEDFSTAIFQNIGSQPPLSINLGVTTLQIPLLQVTADMINGVFTGLNAFPQLLGAGGSSAVQETQTVLNSVAEYLFSAVFMFAIDMSITIGFAMGLARALDTGIEGTASFWANV